jgi:hypothetical protein
MSCTISSESLGGAVAKTTTTTTTATMPLSPVGGLRSMQAAPLRHFLLTGMGVRQRDVTVLRDAGLCVNCKSIATLLSSLHKGCSISIVFNIRDATLLFTMEGHCNIINVAVVKKVKDSLVLY